MTTTATVELPADVFALAGTLNREPTLRMELLQHVATLGGGRAPLLGVRDTGGDLTATEITQCLRTDETVTEARLLSQGYEELLYECVWNEDEVDFDLGVPEAVTVSIMNMVGRAGTWHCQLLCADREALSTLHDHWDRSELSITVKRVRSDGWPDNSARFGLSEDQEAALLSALGAGYYEIPRKSSLCDVAQEVGVSHQALSERLRRGHGQLVERVLDTDDRRTVDEPQPVP